MSILDFSIPPFLKIYFGECSPNWLNFLNLFFEIENYTIISVKVWWIVLLIFIYLLYRIITSKDTLDFVLTNLNFPAQ